MKDEIFYNQIESFLEGKMSDKERKDFESKLALDIQLFKEMDVYISIKRFFEENSWDFDSRSTINKESLEELETYFRSEENKILRNKIRKVQEEYKKKISHRRNYFLIYAALFTGILLVVSYFYFSTQSDNLELYTHYVNYNDLPSISSRSSSDKILKVAKEYFNNKQYDKAAVNFKKYIEKTEQINPSIFVYLAFSLLENNKYKEALKTIDSFEKLNDLDRNKAYWYKSLIYLKKNDLLKAKVYLTKLTLNEKNYKYKEAKELLRKLK